MLVAVQYLLLPLIAIVYFYYSTMSSLNSLPPVIPPDITQSVTSFTPRLQILVVGDSLTQRGSEPSAWATLLAHYYSRKADLINRGYSGYNSNHIRAMIEVHREEGIWCAGKKSNQQTLITLCLGANDACLPDGYSAAQSVPVEEYAKNLEAIGEMLMERDVEEGNAATSTPSASSSTNTSTSTSTASSSSPISLIIISPPQCDESSWSLITQQRHSLSYRPTTRDNSHTKKYADASREVAAKLGVPFIDMYALTPKEEWRSLLVDGLHYTEKGNHLLFTQLISTIEKHYPHLRASVLPVDSFPFAQITERTYEATKERFKKHTLTNQNEKKKEEAK